jgi:hypothetical protein
MLRYFDRTLCALLLLGAAGHTMGSLQFYRGQPHPLFWALGGTLFLLLLAAINVLRGANPGNRGIAWVAVIASAAQIGNAIGFGMLIGNVLDFRVILFALICLGLVLIGLRDALTAEVTTSDTAATLPA